MDRRSDKRLGAFEEPTTDFTLRPPLCAQFPSSVFLYAPDRIGEDSAVRICLRKNGIMVREQSAASAARNTFALSFAWFPPKISRGSSRGRRNVDDKFRQSNVIPDMRDRGDSWVLGIQAFAVRFGIIFAFYLRVYLYINCTARCVDARNFLSFGHSEPWSNFVLHVLAQEHL